MKCALLWSLLLLLLLLECMMTQLATGVVECHEYTTHTLTIVCAYLPLIS